MEVTPEDDTQTVLLEGMEGTQYITIHRADGEALTKGVPLFTLNGELISDGMVVDMISADVGTEYTATQYYEDEDLLPPDMTEEDRRLAAALVAVQFQQQQKEQLNPNDDRGLQDVVQLQTLENANIYSVNSISESNPNVSYPALPAYKQEEVNLKCEDDEVESIEDPPVGLKRLLPHKKRIPRKLKQQGKKGNFKKDPLKVNQDPLSGTTIPAFTCELCGNIIASQLKFFEHLKSHYEPANEDVKHSDIGNNISVGQTVEVDNNVIEEFSEPEDLMEGIRGVVEETGAHIDDDTDNQSSETNDICWPSTEEIDNLENITRKGTVQEVDLVHEDEIADIPEPAKKKRGQKLREDHTCKHCKRYFNHKNSLIYHLRSHSGERPHQCEVCGKSFFAASALKVHKRLHSGDKPYKCEDCGRKFRQWGDLKYHSTSLHSELRQFQCEYCGKDFARKYSLIVHRRIHTGEKNYRCEYCNKTFRASSYLQNHRRIHTGEKPHPCTICGKPFRVRSDMKRHMMTHTRGRTERTTNKSSAAKPKIKEDIKTTPSTTRPKTVDDLVDALKLEIEPRVQPGSIGRYAPVPLVAPEENHESILPHESANLDYVPNNEEAVGRELETTIRSSDSFHYLFM